MPHSVFLLEDHPVMREGYRSLIDAEPELTVCGEAATAEEAMGKLHDLDPSVVVVDLSLPGTNGVEFIKRLHALTPDVPILVVTAHEEDLYAERALRAGARGYLMKAGSSKRFVEAIRTVLRGGLFLTDELQSRLLEQQLDGGDVRGMDRLSDREIEVFEHFGRGKRTVEVAEALGLSVKTIESHRANIKKKLGLSNSAEFTKRAVLWVESPMQ